MKIIGMIPVYNDDDIIKEIIEYYLSQGLDLVILDNGSSDKTYEICKSFLGKGVLKLITFHTSNYISKWDSILRTLYDIALEQTPDWIVKIDSDEFLESGLEGLNLRDAIIQVDNEGCNFIQFDRFDFFMTDDNNESSKSIKKKLPYYSYHGDYLYRAWKYYPGVRVEAFAFVHFPTFPDEIKYKIYPRKFVMRHYPFRTREQTEKKIADRIRGTDYKKTKQGLNMHYKNLVEQNCSQKIDHNILTKYEEDGKWDYEIKFQPYMHDKPLKKEEIFTDKGELKLKFKSAWELKMELHDLYKKTFELRIKRKIYRIKESINEKINQNKNSS